MKTGDHTGIANIEQFKKPGEIFDALLDALSFGEVVEVLFDARRAECRVPDDMRTGGQWFHYSRQMTPPILDLVAGDEGVSAIMSRGGVPISTFVPWTAVGLVRVPTGVGERAIKKLTAPKLKLVAVDEIPEGEEAAPVFVGGGLRLIKGGA